MRPFGVHPLTLKILEENNVAAEGLLSKPVTDELLDSAEKTIVLCRSAHLLLKPKLKDRNYEFWDIEDPLSTGTNEAELYERFRKTYAVLEKKIAEIVK